jgi:hypothetical protein
MKKNIYIGLIIFVLLAVGVYVSRNSSRKTQTMSVIAPTSTEQIATTGETSTVKGGVQSTQPDALLDRAWDVFTQYAMYAGKHDIEGVKKLSYKLSSICADPKQVEACYMRMDTVADVKTILQKKDFTNIWSDDKQIILFSNPVITHTAEGDSYKNGFIFFTRDAQGDPKMLAIVPSRQWVATREATTTDAQVAETLKNMVKDTDQDGITDMGELCLEGVTEKQGCIKTDPYRRDTNTNGYWDGVEQYFYR